MQENKKNSWSCVKLDIDGNMLENDNPEHAFKEIINFKASSSSPSTTSMILLGEMLARVNVVPCESRSLRIQLER